MDAHFGNRERRCSQSIIRIDEAHKPIGYTKRFSMSARHNREIVRGVTNARLGPIDDADAAGVVQRTAQILA